AGSDRRRAVAVRACDRLDARATRRVPPRGALGVAGDDRARSWHHAARGRAAGGVATRDPPAATSPPRRPGARAREARAMTATLLEISPDEYHTRPAFSSSLAKILIDRSPLHAKQARGKTPTKQMDRGTAGHTFLLGKGKRIEPVPFDSYHTK